MKTVEYFCYGLAFVKGILLFALPETWVIGIVTAEVVVIPFVALCLTTSGHENSARLFGILRNCIFIYLPALGIGALIFGMGL